MNQKKLLPLVVFLLCWGELLAQSRVSFYGGWTVSQVRAIPRANFQPGPLGNDFFQFPVLHYPAAGFEYEYNHRHLRLSTGVGMVCMGSSKGLFFQDHPWLNWYWTIPMMAGCRMDIAAKTDLILEGGFQVALRQGGGGIMSDMLYWGDLALSTGVVVDWRRFKIGVRGYWGLFNAQKLLSHEYRYAAVTTSISYVFYDQAKVKARRLQKKQAAGHP